MGAADSEPSRLARRARARVLVAFALGATSLGILWTDRDWLTRLPHWFWYEIDKPPGTPAQWSAILGLFLVIAGIATGAAPRASFWRRVGVLGLAGYALELVVVATEGRGMEPLRAHFLRSGHGQFVTAAIAHGERPDLVSSYVALARDGTLGQYAPTKPPGTLLLYVLTESLSRPFATADTAAARRVAVGELAIWLWPAIAMVVVFPLAALVRNLTRDHRAAVLACALFVCTPSVVLVQMHTDQVFFPLFATTAAWLASEAARRGSVPWAIGSALAFVVALLSSFGLAVMAPVMMALFASGPAPRWRRFLVVAIPFALTLVIAYLVVRSGLGFDWLVDYHLAAERHTAWKGWDYAPSTYLYFGFLDSLEFAFWVGAALSAFAITSAWRAAREARRGITSPTARLALGVAAMVVLVLVLGKTKAEVARLWLFMVPVVCAIVAHELRRTARELGAQRPALPRWLPAALLATQIALVWLLKTEMDFH